MEFLNTVNNAHNEMPMDIPRNCMAEVVTIHNITFVTKIGLAHKIWVLFSNHIGEYQRLGCTCAYAQSPQSLDFSHTQTK